MQRTFQKEFEKKKIENLQYLISSQCSVDVWIDIRLIE